MRKKGLLLVMVLVLLFGGCGAAPSSEERVLPTMDPAVEVQKGNATEQKGNAEDAVGTEKEDEKGTLGGMYHDFMSYVDSSKQAMDRNQADTVAVVLEVACIEAQIQGMEFPKEPIRFRYTNELDELDDSYSLLKEAYRNLMGDDVIELKVEGNYLMVEIFKDDSGNPKVNVELLQE